MYEKEDSIYHVCLDVAEMQQNSQLIATAQNNLGYSSKYLNNIGSAASHFKSNIKGEVSETEATALQNFAIIEQNKGNPKYAIQLLQKAVIINEKLDKQYEKAIEEFRWIRIHAGSMQKPWRSYWRGANHHNLYSR